MIDLSVISSKLVLDLCFIEASYRGLPSHVDLTYYGNFIFVGAASFRYIFSTLLSVNFL